MSDLSELIETAKNIEKQNSEIIRLLKKIAGEDEQEDKFKKYQEMLNYNPDLGELYLSNDKIQEKKEQEKQSEIENKFQIGDLLENSSEVGEVYFIDQNNIFKLSVKDNETTINNLTGESNADDFALQELVANESIKNNICLDDSTVILSMKQSENLAETLKICVEQGAEKVYLPLFASAQLVSAPQILMEILELDFYRTDDELIEKLFN